MIRHTQQRWAQDYGVEGHAVSAAPIPPKPTPYVKPYLLTEEKIRELHAAIEDSIFQPSPAALRERRRRQALERLAVRLQWAERTKA